MFFFSGNDNNYSIYFYEESENLFVKCIDNLTNYEVSMMIDYIDNQRNLCPKDKSVTK